VDDYVYTRGYGSIRLALDGGSFVNLQGYIGRTDFSANGTSCFSILAWKRGGEGRREERERRERIEERWMSVCADNVQ
jgi:hypothetical protein